MDSIEKSVPKEARAAHTRLMFVIEYLRVNGGIAAEIDDPRLVNTYVQWLRLDADQQADFMAEEMPDRRTKAIAKRLLGQDVTIPGRVRVVDDTPEARAAARAKVGI